MNFFKGTAALITIIAAFFINSSFNVKAADVEIIDPILDPADFVELNEDFEVIERDPVLEAETSETEVLYDQPVELVDYELDPLETTEPIITDIADLNIFLDFAVNELTLRINAAALEHETEITFPDDFALNAGTIVGEVIYTDVDQLFRHIFIVKILEYLGIPEDSPLYDILYDVIGEYYDQLTSQDEQNNDSAVGVVLLSMCGFALSLSVLKWVMF